MDPNINKALTDKLYDKRKAGALELENVIRDALGHRDFDRIDKIVDQLCHEYAYTTHHPNSRNGGLIGLAAAAIALGPDVARYLREIVPPVLACFNDSDARVRYYACESMYNISKVAKGEILVYFNDVFDTLCKLAADNELSVKNGAELLDRLIKDIVSESAADYVSILKLPESKEAGPEPEPAFSLPKFVPLLQERITVLAPNTRMFLVGWITLLDSIPDLELVTYLPSFLDGLFKFLSDDSQDVHTATQAVLERFLLEIKKIARLKQGLALKQSKQDKKSDTDSDNAHPEKEHGTDSLASGESGVAEDDDLTDHEEDDWIPGQDVQIDYAKILEILVSFLGTVPDQEIQLTVLRWIDSFFEICPEEILAFVPRLLAELLPALSNVDQQVREAAGRANNSLMDYILTLPDGHTSHEVFSPVHAPAMDRRESAISTVSKVPRPAHRDSIADRSLTTPEPAHDAQSTVSSTHRQIWNLDWEATVSAITLQFLNDNEATRVAALNWLMMLHRKAPSGRKLEINDGTFAALLKTLSDPSDAVVTRDLALLSQMSRNTDEAKFSAFMVDLLNLFSTDRKLLELRGNLIIRQLCISLNPERIFRTLADCLEKDEDLEFASIMVQNLNNNLITAPELADLRRRLRNLDNKDGQAFFVALFRSWSHNAVATFSLCLLAQAYEQAYHLLQVFGEIEMTLPLLIQIDKLVQLLESPIFTYLRLQLLEPERFPYLYKCLYGLLMLLPQSAAFATLKNRLNSVSAIGYLGAPPSTKAGTGGAGGSSFSSAAGERPNRLKREDTAIRWGELFEKFRSTQDRARRGRYSSYASGNSPPPPLSLSDRDEHQQRRGTMLILGGAGGAGGGGGVGSMGPPARPGNSGGGTGGAAAGGGLGQLLGGSSSLAKAVSSPSAATGAAQKESNRLRTGLGLRFGGGGKKVKK